MTSKMLKATLSFGGEPLPSFYAVHISLVFPHDVGGIVSARNAMPRLVISTDARSAADMPAVLVQAAVDSDDLSSLVLTEELPGEETLTLTFEKVAIGTGRLATSADGNLAMDFSATAISLSNGDATFESEREYL